jgi:acyl carrier protein
MEKAQVIETVIKLANKHFNKKPGVITESTHIIDDLGGDSLDAVELVMALEDEFRVTIPEEKMETARTIQAISDVVYNIVSR